MKKRLIRRADKFDSRYYYANEAIEMLNKFNPQFSKAETSYQNALNRLNEMHDDEQNTKFSIEDFKELKDMKYAIEDITLMFDNIAS